MPALCRHRRPRTVAQPRLLPHPGAPAHSPRWAALGWLMLTTTGWMPVPQLAGPTHVFKATFSSEHPPRPHRPYRPPAPPPPVQLQTSEKGLKKLTECFKLYKHVLHDEEVAGVLTSIFAKAKKGSAKAEVKVGEGVGAFCAGLEGWTVLRCACPCCHKWLCLTLWGAEGSRLAASACAVLGPTPTAQPPNTTRRNPINSNPSSFVCTLQALIEEFEAKVTEYAAERAEEERTAEAARQHAERRRGEAAQQALGWAGEGTAALQQTLPGVGEGS